ncbi:MAG: SDR family oxidoreductase [Desulfobacterales bacterium]|nr:SDR family oxidoreductase [Desulfobacterales bacterium]
MKIQRDTKVMITGAASDIGRATAIAMARRAAHLFLTDINARGLAETCDLVLRAGGTIGGQRVFDITSLEEMQAFAREVHASAGAIEVLINNAGIALFALVEDMCHDHWAKVIDTNLWGAIHAIECFLPEMIRARKGHVVNISSTAGLTGAPWHAAYATAKWGLVGLSEVLRYDLGQHRIGVTVVCPGAVDTPLKHSVEILAVDKQSRPVQEVLRRFDKRTVSPEHVAGLIIAAVEKQRFLVITSWDIQLLYLLKRYCFPAYHMILSRISTMLNRMKAAA